MVYNNAIPQSTDLISNSQSQILANFSAIDNGTTGTSGSGFSRNHISMSDTDYPGRHYLIELPETQSGDPSLPATASSAIYTKTISTYGQPFFYNSNLAAGQVIWYGGTGTGYIAATGVASNGYVNLPNGLQFRWGTTVAGTGGTSVTFASAFSTNCFAVTLTPAGTTSRGAAYGNKTTTGFTAYAENSSTTMSYWAVGN